MPTVLGRILGGILQMDLLRIDLEDDRVVYTFVTTGAFRSLQEVKAKALMLLDLPVDIAMDVNIEETKRGPIFKDYLVKVSVPIRGVGKISDLLARKYGIFRRRPYSGEW